MEEILLWIGEPKITSSTSLSICNTTSTNGYSLDRRTILIRDYLLIQGTMKDSKKAVITRNCLEDNCRDYFFSEIT